MCCLLVLNSVTSTPHWIRQPKAAWGLCNRYCSNKHTHGALCLGHAQRVLSRRATAAHALSCAALSEQTPRGSAGAHLPIPPSGGGRRTSNSAAEDEEEDEKCVQCKSEENMCDKCMPHSEEDVCDKYVPHRCLGQEDHQGSCCCKGGRAGRQRRVHPRKWVRSANKPRQIRFKILTCLLGQQRAGRRGTDIKT